LIGGLGVAIGAILAASLPTTRAETGVMGKASDRVKRATSTATQSGFEAAKETVLSAADAAAKSVAQSDLGKHAVEDELLRDHERSEAENLEKLLAKVGRVLGV